MTASVSQDPPPIACVNEDCDGSVPFPTPTERLRICDGCGDEYQF